MSVPELWLRKLYAHKGEFYILVMPGAIFFCEPPGSYNIKGESIVHLFLSVAEAESFKDLVNNGADVKIAKITLIGLFSLIPDINRLSKKHFQVPARIQVTTVDCEGRPRAIDTLHSSLEESS